MCKRLHLWNDVATFVVNDNALSLNIFSCYILQVCVSSHFLPSVHSIAAIIYLCIFVETLPFSYTFLVFFATFYDMLYMFGRKESQFHASTTSKSIFEQYVLCAVGIAATTLLYQKPNEWWWFSFLHHQYRFVWACVHVIFFGFLTIHVCSLILYRTDRLSLLCLHFFSTRLSVFSSFVFEVIGITFFFFAVYLVRKWLGIRSFVIEIVFENARSQSY